MEETRHVKKDRFGLFVITKRTEENGICVRKKVKAGVVYTAERTNEAKQNRKGGRLRFRERGK